MFAVREFACVCVTRLTYAQSQCTVTDVVARRRGSGIGIGIGIGSIVRGCAKEFMWLGALGRRPEGPGDDG